MRKGFYVMLMLSAILSGCVTTGSQQGAVLSEKSAKKFAEDFKDPRRYWLSIYRSATGEPGVKGGFRLHPLQVADLRIQKSAVPFRPFIKVKSDAFTSHLALLDIASPECWSDYEMNRKLELKIAQRFDGQQQ